MAWTREQPARLIVVTHDDDLAPLLDVVLARAQIGPFEIGRQTRVDAAIQAITRDTYHVALVDERAVGLGGREFLRQIQRGGVVCPVLVFLESRERSALSRTVQAGAFDAFFLDAIDPAHLERSISHAFHSIGASHEAKQWRERYSLVARGASEGLWDWDLRSDDVFYSERWKATLGHEPTEIGERPIEWVGRVHPEYREALLEQLVDHHEGRTPIFEFEYPILHKDGGYRWMKGSGVVARDATGSLVRMAGSQSDITQRKLFEQQRLHDAYHDAMTGLPNREFFVELLERALLRARKRDGYRFAAFFVDLDRFSLVNKSLGHNVGDQLLVGAARRIQQTLRPGDIVARLGADEFAVLTEDIADANDAFALADRLQKNLSQPYEIDTHEVFTSASIGVALSETGYQRPEDVLRDAHTAMYRAKSLGRSRNEVFDKNMHRLAMERLQVETDLRHALDRNELSLRYQPIIALDTGRIVAFEALLRWRNSRRGDISPAEFIPLAEETGLIVPIGKWVLEEACRQTRAWQTRFPSSPPLGISVNLSGRQFADPDLVRQIADIQERTGVDTRSLRLEITESLMMENADTASRMLLSLKELAIHLYIDDFGTGYSSLSRLPTFPIDTLKIDRSFVSELTNNGPYWEIVRTIIGLARTLNLEVVAEGVESSDHVDKLTNLGCHLAQGYFFSRPLDQQGAERLLAKAG